LSGPGVKPPGILAGLVLAGGRSRRFGAEKAVAPYLGRPMMDWSLDILAAGCQTLAVNAPAGSGAAALAASKGLAVVSDAAGDPDGPLSGVLAGLVWARNQGAGWLVTVPCDMPGLPDDLLEQLIQRAGSGPGARLETADGRQPLCALWSIGLIAPLRQALDLGHPPVWAFQDHAGMRRARLEVTLANLNRPDDQT
jgi:molybdopterin-guanine dinucleotide biosynthesis protein A